MPFPHYFMIFLKEGKILARNAEINIKKSKSSKKTLLKHLRRLSLHSFQLLGIKL